MAITIPRFFICHAGGWIEFVGRGFLRDDVGIVPYGVYPTLIGIVGEVPPAGGR